MDTAAIKVTTGWPKPATASCIVSTPLKLSAKTTRIATTSGRTRPDANRPTAAASTPKTVSMSPVIAYPGSKNPTGPSPDSRAKQHGLQPSLAKLMVQMLKGEERCQRDEINHRHRNQS